MRYRLCTLLILLAVVGLWLSTIAGYESANHVRALLILSVLVASGVAVTKYDGRRRAFWVGFFLTVLMGLVGKYQFGLPWAERLLNGYEPLHYLYQHVWPMQAMLDWYIWLYGVKP